MPDVWTANPPKLKRALTEAGAICPAEPRVLKNRDREWTCQINRETPDEHGVIGYDIYIHHAANLWAETGYPMAAFFTAAGILIGFLWGRRFGKTP